MAEQPKSRDHEERIRRRAYELWEREGRPESGQEQHWLRAEAELEASGFGGNQGEGNREAALAFDRSQSEFARTADVAGKGASARDALEGPEGNELRRAERAASAHSHGEDVKLRQNPEMESAWRR